MKKVFEYYFPELGEKPVDARRTEVEIGSYSLEAIALQIVEDWYIAEDGWEAEFPVALVLLDEAGSESNFKINLDLEPTFSAELL